MKKIIISSLLALGLVFNLGINTNAAVSKVKEPVEEETVIKKVEPILYSTGMQTDGGGGTSCSHHYIPKTQGVNLGGSYTHYYTEYICEFCGKTR